MHMVVVGGLFQYEELLRLDQSVERKGNILEITHLLKSTFARDSEISGY